MTENEATKEMTFDEEYEILKKEKEQLFSNEEIDCEPPFANCVVRRALRCIRKLLEEIQAYRAIGTVEEFKELKEKSEPKEPLKIKTDEKILYMCPCCRKIFVEAYDTVQRGYIPKYCEMCGKNIKWSWGQ